MLSTLALLSNLALATGAFAQQGSGGLFGFFDGRDIDYWGEGRRVHEGLKLEAGGAPPSEEETFSGSTVVRGRDSQPFSWDVYQNPQSPEFWDDGGDWIAPRPFREAVASPTPENIDRYLAWQGRKAEVLGKFQTALSQRASLLLPKAPEKPKAQVNAQVPWSEVKIAYFYQTSCPHCRASKDSIEAARRLGAQVTFIQLDHQSAPPMHTPSIPYDKDWEAAFHIAATPTWVLSMRGKTLKHTGALSLDELTRFTSLITKEDHHEQLP